MISPSLTMQDSAQPITNNFLPDFQREFIILFSQRRFERMDAVPADGHVVRQVRETGHAPPAGLSRATRRAEDQGRRHRDQGLQVPRYSLEARSFVFAPMSFPAGVPVCFRFDVILLCRGQKLIIFAWYDVLLA